MAQKIEIFKNDYSKIYNRDFNAKIRSISDEIFQTRHIYPAGYIPVNVYKEEQLKFSAYRHEDNNITKPSTKANIDEEWKTLSEYEVIIASHLLYGSYDTYIFSGGMGSGKTSTACHVLNFIKNKYSSSESAFINIHFDFNLKVNDDDKTSNGVIARFIQQMYENLKLEIFNFIEGNSRDVLKNFVSKLISIKFNEYADFFDFRKAVQALEWAKLSMNARAELFFEFVEKDPGHIRRVEKLMKFLRFLKEDLTENEYIVILYDNIDILDPPIQHEIFAKYILPLNQIARCKCLISLRRTTFTRNFDYTDVHFAHSFGFIHHHGHQTSDIIKDRLNFYVKNIETEKLFKEIDSSYRLALKNRLTFLLQEFNSSFSPHNLGPFINSLSGNSVRLGLYMANRLLINSIVRYDENPSQRTLFKRALIVNDETNLLIGDKEEIINLFSVGENYSLLRLKILHDVNLAHRENRRIRITDVINSVIASNLHTNEEIKRCSQIAYVFSPPPPMDG